MTAGDAANTGAGTTESASTGVPPTGTLPIHSLRPAAAFLAIAVALALAFPPEVHRWTGPCVALLLAAGLWTSPRGGRAAPVLIAGLLAAFNLAVSLAPGRTVTALAQFSLAAAAAYLAVRIAPRDRRAVVWSVFAVGAGLGLLAIFQKVWLLSRMAADARAAGAAAEVITRLSAGRAYGTHLVPASLAGALALALFCAALIWTTGRRRVLVACGMLLILVGLVATVSFGGMVGVFAGALVLVVPRWWSLSPGRRMALIAGAAIALGAALLIFASLRHTSVLDPSRSDNPLLLRLGNWRGAVLMARDRPIAGTGLGSFGALYAQVRRVGDGATQYAHNSFLQLGAEGGLPTAVLLTVALVWLVRRAYARNVVGDERLLVAAATAFAAHNLLDFTAYLPGVAVPALALWGLAFARDDLVPSAEGAESSRRGPQLVALLVALAALPLAGDWLARRALDDGEARLPVDRSAEVHVAPEVQLAVGHDVDLVRRVARWDPVLLVRAGWLALRLAPTDPHAIGTAAALAERAIRLDARSPAPWHLLGEVRLTDGRPSDAWRALSLAALRHPADPQLRARLEALAHEMKAQGLFAQPLAYGAEVALPSRLPWENWDDLLLAMAVLLAAAAAWRWLRPGGAPAAALALASLLVFVPWGEGGALPGARLGHQLLIAVAGLSVIAPRRRTPAEGSDQIETPARWPLLALAGAGAWAALSAAVAPDGAAARDGWCALAGVLLVVALSWQLAVQHPRWCAIAIDLFAIGAGLLALLWLVQRGAGGLGLDLTHAPVPLQMLASARPAADFLHPGHLGTFLVAAALALAGSAIGATASGWRLIVAALLAVCGLAGGARSSLIALVAGGLVIIATSSTPRLRRILTLILLGLVALGVAFVLWRFAAGDPYAFRRIGIWRAALTALAARPLVGFGPGAFASVAARYAFEDPGRVAHWGRVFDAPHSDLLGAFLSLGLPGGSLLIAGLASLGWRAWKVVADPDLRTRAGVGACAALAAFAAHALFDDIFNDRPAVRLVAAILLGAAAGAGSAAVSPWHPSRAARWAMGVGVIVALLAGEALPWLADRVHRHGDPVRAALLDPARAQLWLAAARTTAGGPEVRLARTMDRVARGVLALSGSDAPWQEQALVLDAACRTTLPTRDTCTAALKSWGEVLERRPHDALARFGRARLQAALDDDAAALADLEAALADEPNFLGAQLEKVALLIETQRMAEARTAFEHLGATMRALHQRRPESGYEEQLLVLPSARYRQIAQQLSAAAP